MSEQVHFVGVLRPVERKYHESLEEQCQKICMDNGYKQLDGYLDSWTEVIFEELYDKYVVVNDNLYEVLSKRMLENHDVYSAHRNLDGTISYEVSYYNGGCCFEEALEEAFRYI